MHPNLAFRSTKAEVTLEFLHAYGFGTLSVNGEDGPLMAHIPFWISADGTRVEGHLARSNPILRALKTAPQKAVLAVMGPHSYISPDWYEIGDQVPTWNYVAAHLRGDLALEPAQSLPGHLARLSARFESQPGLSGWTMDKVAPEAMDKLLRMIVPVSLTGISIDATWKLGQNKPEAARLSAAAKVATNGIGDGLDELAHWMRDPPPKGD